MTTDRDDNLTWLAYQYVANELDANQRSAFETRLASDQAARDAVADVVLIHQALEGTATVNHSPKPASAAAGAPETIHLIRRSSRTVWSPTAVWSRTAATTIAALALLVLTSVLLRTDPAPPPAAPLAMTSAGPGSGQDASSLIVLWHDLHAPPSLDPSDPQNLADEPEPSADAIPDWMFVALNASTEAVPALDEMDMDTSDGPWPVDPAQEQL